MSDPCANMRAGLVAELRRRRLSRARLRALLDLDLPPEPRTFSVWTGSTIGGHNLIELCDAVKALAPPGEWRYEWWPKSGEGGTWQATWDPSPLAIGSVNDLEARLEFAAGLGVRVVPWAVVRGRPEWAMAERLMIRQCARVAGVCVLNLESGPAYWNGPTDPAGVTAWLDALDLPPEQLWLTYVPRQTEVNALGGIDAMRIWLSRCAGASLECYLHAPAPDLSPALAIPRMRVLFPEFGDWHYIPLIQRSMLPAWAEHETAGLAVQVWHLGGD